MSLAAPVLLSLTARTLYAELREQALAIGVRENMAEPAGSVVNKVVKGKTYLYYQFRDLGGYQRQAYLGQAGERTEGVLQRLAASRESLAEDRQRLSELRAAFIGAGGAALEHAPMRVLQAFAQAGVLQPGLGCATLVGTHAFNLLGNLLGVRWHSRMQTQDIDVAGERDVDIAVSRPLQPVPDVLAQLGMGFIPAPTLDPREPSTSFRVRGQEMRVDLLTPLVGKPGGGPVFVPVLQAAAQPLRFLDYLLEEPVAAVAVGRSALALVNVPSPERFALHKLLVSESREAVFAAKAEKDRVQAVQLLAVLLRDAPDGLPGALAALRARGKGWEAKLLKALGKAERMAEGVVAEMRGM